MAIHAIHVNNTTVVTDTDIPENVAFTAHQETLDLGRSMKDQRLFDYVLKIRYEGDNFVCPYGLEWRRYVQAARDRHEQNLELYREPDGAVCLRTVRHIFPGEELLAWYDTSLALELDVPIIAIQNIRDAGSYICLKCGFESEFPNPLKIHMMSHCKNNNTCDPVIYKPLLVNGTPVPTSSTTQRPAGETNVQKHSNNGVFCNNQELYDSSTDVYSQLNSVLRKTNDCVKKHSVSESSSLSCNVKYGLGHCFRSYNIKTSVFVRPTFEEEMDNLFRSDCAKYSLLQPHGKVITRKSSLKDMQSDLRSPSRVSPSNINNDEQIDVLHRSFLALSSRKGHLCLYCGKFYSRKYGLKIHLRTHTGYKPLKCRICNRPFGDPSNLNKHVRLHAEGDTPYKCEICGKILVRRRDLRRHVKSRHPNNDLI